MLGSAPVGSALDSTTLSSALDDLGGSMLSSALDDLGGSALSLALDDLDCLMINGVSNSAISFVMDDLTLGLALEGVISSPLGSALDGIKVACHYAQQSKSTLAV